MKQFKTIIQNIKIVTWLFIVICATSSIVHAQTRTSIRGVIKNQDTNLPIEGVNIQLQNANIGTSTNDKGVFELSNINLPAVLIVTHISYFGIQIIATQNTANSMIIMLNPRMVTLSEAEVTAETYKVFKGIHQEIIDYNFLDTNVLILSCNFNENRYELILTDDDFDTISIKDVSYINKPKQLHRDCMGTSHLLTKDSAYQLYFDNQSIQLIYPIHLAKYYSILGDCLFETSQHIAFENRVNNNPKKEYAAIDVTDLPSFTAGDDKWKHSFYLIDKKTHETTVLDDVYESEKKRDAFDHALFVAKGSRRFFGDILRFAEMVYYKPAFQSLHVLADTIYYFNHLKSQLDIFSSDLILIKSIPVDYHNQNNWKPIIIVDNEMNRIYTIFTTGSMYSLAEINLKNGLVSKVAKFEKLFPQKIRVNNGRLYFLYVDVNNVWDKRKLYQGDLDDGF